ncbi:efflux transporter outer membrane subunit [Ferrovum sp.]|uniref:efflux transporter outer membrane subunit n=1 Tax=Ferrovum sp. TaxID=2609467 RepID=UPI002621D00E|nr:efflux transporter outer membrane subunit [Ferrovum sp.]
MKPLGTFLYSALTIALLGGCSFIPDYHRPDNWKSGVFKEDGPWRLVHPADAESRGDWWTYFNDATLNQMEKELNSDNFVIQEALERYDQATAFLTQQDAQLYPQINFMGDVTTNRQSAHRLYRNGNQANVNGDTIGGIGFVYEIDFWGAIRSAIASAEASAQASKADIESARLSLEALLASDYVKLRGLDSEIGLLEVTVKDYEHELELMQQRHDVGITSGLDVARSKALLEETRAQVAKTVGARALYEHSIAVLLGREPSTFTLKADTEWIYHAQYAAIPKVIPSEVLQRRPDIAAAERNIVAANDQVGVARTAFFPTISLMALAGFENNGYGALATAPNSFWSLGPLAFYNIFDAGLRQAVVDQATSKTRQQTDKYRQTVLIAFREVEDSLSQINNLGIDDVHQKLAVESARRTFDLANHRYIEGASNYLDVIDAEAVRLRTEREEIYVRTALNQSVVDLVRSIGGSW